MFSMHVHTFIRTEQDGFLLLVGFCPVWKCIVARTRNAMVSSPLGKYIYIYMYTYTVLARQLCYGMRCTCQKAAAPQLPVKRSNVTSSDPLHWPLFLDETHVSSITALSSRVSASACGNKPSFRHSDSTQILRRASAAANGVYATAQDLPGAVQGLASSLCLHIPLARCVESGLACIRASVP